MEDNIKEYGIVNAGGIEIITIIGEIEGHEQSVPGRKTTCYEHIIPKLAQICLNDSVKGILFIINTVGGDVSCGLAIAEMIKSIKKPTVSYVVGDSHSIGVPIAVAADYSFIASTATIMLHPVRMSGVVLGTEQTGREFKSIQDRITGFVAKNSNCPENELTAMMMGTEMFAKDLGTILVGEEAVKTGIINCCGGFCDAIDRLKEIL